MSIRSNAEYLRALGGPGSGPHKGGGKVTFTREQAFPSQTAVAHMTADRASNAARTASRRAHKTGGAYFDQMRAHRKAKESHELASRLHEAIGNKDEAVGHAASAEKHQKLIDFIQTYNK